MKKFQVEKLRSHWLHRRQHTSVLDSQYCSLGIDLGVKPCLQLTFARCYVKHDSFHGHVNGLPVLRNANVKHITWCIKENFHDSKCSGFAVSLPHFHRIFSTLHQ